ESRTASGVIQDLNGGFTVFSSTDRSYGPGFDRDISVIRTDTAGNLTSMHRIGLPSNEMPRSFVQTADSDYVVLGNSTSFAAGQQHIYLARFDLRGCVPHFYDLGVAQEGLLCPGDTLLLDAGPGFMNYQWSNGHTAQTFAMTSGDTVHVQATDSAGCPHYSTWIYRPYIESPTFSWVDQGQGVVDFTSMGQSWTNQTWDFGDGGSDTAANPTHVFMQNGAYEVCLTVPVAGCGMVEVCDTVVIMQVGLAEMEADVRELQVWPVPASAGWNMRWGVELGVGMENGVVEVVDLAGRVVAREGFAGNKGNMVQMRRNGLAAGWYGLRLRLEDGRVFRGKVLLRD
ncbi:MAG: PKD domain-containing protein, partial [Bacteroidota bacterium]